MLQHAPIIVWEIDRQGIFTLSLGQGLQQLGLRAGEVVGQSVWDMYREMPLVLEALQRTLSGHEQQLLVDLGGVYFDSWMRPLFDEAGQVRGAFGVASDVTRRIRAEEQERSSSERFLKAFHASPAGILVSDCQTGQVFEVNQAFCQLIGQAREAVIGTTLQQLGLSQPDCAAMNGNNPHVPREVPDGFERIPTSTTRGDRLRLASGQQIAVKVVAEQVELDGRRCALLIVRDNRREARIQRRLQRIRRRYRLLNRFAPVGIFQADGGGDLRWVNRQCCEVVGQTRSALLVGGWWPFVADESRPGFREAWDRAIQARQSLSYEFQVQVGEQQTWVLLQMEPETETQGFLGSLSDIDRRKRAELELQSANQRLEEHVRSRTELLMRTHKTLEEQIFARRRTYEDLEKSEERWRSLVENAPDVILLIDLEGRVQYINHTRLRPQLGTHNVLGRSIFDFTFPEFHEEIRGILRRVFADGQSTVHEAQGPGDDGLPRVFESHLAPIHYMGQVIGATVITRDVTPQRKSLEELKQTQDRLAHVGRVSMAGELMAGFAHELGQPLFAISSYIEGCLIRLQRESQAPAEVLEVLSDAIEQSHRAIDVVRRLREYLQKQEIQRSFTSLNQIVRDSVKLADVSLRRHRARCEVKLEEGLVDVYVDRVQIMQVLLNLILNAAEAMDHAEVAQPLITIRTSERSGRLVCEVSDIGPGLPSNSAHEIFEAFFTTKSSGLGLGLSISRSIVEAHGGTITAANQRDHGGAVFVLELPVMASSQPAHPALHPQASQEKDRS